ISGSIYLSIPGSILLSAIGRLLPHARVLTFSSRNRGPGPDAHLVDIPLSRLHRKLPGILSHN
ncbi:MAG: hypothetical protein QME81_06955, partial [bacterium]|nr:hypothetical protein [bacterium]